MFGYGGDQWIMVENCKIKTNLQDSFSWYLEPQNTLNQKN
jgi:hypothetical protein